LPAPPGVSSHHERRDIVADLTLLHVDRLVAGLTGTFYIDPDAVTRAIVRHRSFNVIHHDSGFKVDVFVCACLSRIDISQSVKGSAPAAV
jgi:hypothetical protein